MKKPTKIAAVLTMMTVAMTSLTACGGGNDKGGAAMTAAATTAGETTTKAATTKAPWGLTYDALTLYDAKYKAIMSMDWDASSDGKQIELVNKDVEKQVFEQITAEKAVGAIAVLAGYAAAVQ